jgi:hypothetical protein
MTEIVFAERPPKWWFPVSLGTAPALFARNPKPLSHMGAGAGVVMIGLGGALALTVSKS